MTPGVKVLITAMVRAEKFIVPVGRLGHRGRGLPLRRRRCHPGPGAPALLRQGDGAAPAGHHHRRRQHRPDARRGDRKNGHLRQAHRKEGRTNANSWPPAWRRPSSCTATGRARNSSRRRTSQETDFFIAVTNDEEANILGALLAKQLGARKVISLINRIDYIPLVCRVGIDGVINPRHAAISRILHFIRKGKVISATPLRDEKAEAFEFIALETSEITDRPFKEIHSPGAPSSGRSAAGRRSSSPTGIRSSGRATMSSSSPPARPSASWRSSSR